jgi:hypothetical protein
MVYQVPTLGQSGKTNKYHKYLVLTHPYFWGGITCLSQEAHTRHSPPQPWGGIRMEITDLRLLTSGPERTLLGKDLMVLPPKIALTYSSE